MSKLSPEQIQEMFRDFGLSDEAERKRLQGLAQLSPTAVQVYNFIRLADSAKPAVEGEDNAELA